MHLRILWMLNFVDRWISFVLQHVMCLLAFEESHDGEKLYPEKIIKLSKTMHSVWEISTQKRLSSFQETCTLFEKWHSFSDDSVIVAAMVLNVQRQFVWFCFSDWSSIYSLECGLVSAFYIQESIRQEAAGLGIRGSILATWRQGSRGWSGDTWTNGSGKGQICYKAPGLPCWSSGDCQTLEAVLHCLFCSLQMFSFSCNWVALGQVQACKLTSMSFSLFFVWFQVGSGNMRNVHFSW